MKRIATVISLIFSVIQIDAQLLSQVSPAMYAVPSYRYIAEMTDIRIALVDCRTNTEIDVAQLMRRYYEPTALVHPSVLSNRKQPDYLIVAASSYSETSTAADMIRQYKTADSKTRFVLLLSNYGDDNAPWSDALSVFDAAFVSFAGNDAFDELTQAFFGGIAVAKADNDAAMSTAGLLPMAQPKTRLAYAEPETVGMSSETLDKIDDIAKKMIDDKASPGCAVLVARRGTIVFNRCYGHTQYDRQTAVTSSMLYDLASVTKATATLPIIMRLYDSNKLQIDNTLGNFFPTLDSLKRNITVEQLLMHQSGLVAGIPAFMMCVDSTSQPQPFYSRYRKSNYTIQLEPKLYLRKGLKLKEGIFSSQKSDLYCHEVTEQLFETDSFRCVVNTAVDNAHVGKKKYNYSDLNFIFLQRIVEQIYGSSIDTLFDRMIAKPLGISRLTYRPLRRYKQYQIVPTENDLYFRHQQIWGTVHDQTAALLGGVAGNAGLFGTAEELAKLGQLFLNQGIYGGVRLIKASTIEEFTRCHNIDNRRGYGFDKPELRDGLISPVTDLASPESFGHTGFSGTLFWIDPANELIFIFLSNRICPYPYNTKLITTNVRSDIHTIVYQAIIE